MKEKWIFLTVLAAILSTLAIGCDAWLNPDGDNADAGRPSHDTPLDVAGTVGQFSRVHDGGYMPVKGYGLMIRLGRNGSGEVPPYLREYLIKELLRNGIGQYTMGTGELSPSRILSDLDTAVVVVRGVIPPRSLRGDRFDVIVTAHSATGTQSLDGGFLMPTDLRLDLGTEGDPAAGSKVWAVAAGAVMLNPFSDSDEPSQAMLLRQGRVVGGGKLSRHRRISLMMIHPDYQLADLIQRRINSRFPSNTRVANAKSREVVELVVPARYHDDPLLFLQLARHLPLNSSPGLWEARARRIVEEMAKTDVNHESLALVLEAQGAKVISIIQPLYESDVEAAAFFGARAGMRLGDSSADASVLAFAQNSNTFFQIPAIDAIGRHRGMPRADMALRELLDDDNNLVRIAAYEALRRRGSLAVIEIDIDGQFHLDIVRSNENNMIYATQSEEPRIVMFGVDLQVNNPMFFNAPDNLVTINANDGAEELTLWRTIPRTGGISDKFRIPFDVTSLIETLGSRAEYGAGGEISGLGLTYGQVVGILYRLCEQDDIDATFALQPLPGEQRLLQGVEDVMAEGAATSREPHISGPGQ